MAQSTGRIAPLSWRKSSYSGSGGGDCIEIACAEDTVHVRDSKDPEGPMLTFSSTQWLTFISFSTTLPNSDT
ncbi:DUF397 domain-containing protein [Wenjunlia vitaminophila]|uniref:DUF397 domain-containing protein n=1 Tax=Wenjunlia vitaminophila TaxID=76728 RepID=UPI00099727B6|nr:DUF397 domain-containing protein [Wenjunlia vitaminophila]